MSRCTSGEGLEGLRIFVVEDTFATALAIQSTLAAIGCTVIGPAARLQEALEMARQEGLDGAVLDVNLDGQYVFPVAEVLRRRAVPFLFATGYRNTEFPAEFRDAPLLEKPFDMRDMVCLMERLFAPPEGAPNGSPPPGVKWW